MFAPKPLKKARRAAHPVSLMTPRPVKRAKMTAVNAANLAGGAKRAAERQAVKTRTRPVASREASELSARRLVAGVFAAVLMLVVASPAGALVAYWYNDGTGSFVGENWWFDGFNEPARAPRRFRWQASDADPRYGVPRHEHWRSRGTHHLDTPHGQQRGLHGHRGRRPMHKPGPRARTHVRRRH